MVTVNLAAPGSLTLRCRKNEPAETDVARETKIIAIKLESATRTPVGG